MQTNIWAGKITVTDLTNQEKINLRRSAVNVTTRGSDLIFEDNIFNRVLLNLPVFVNKTGMPQIEYHSTVARGYQINDIRGMLQHKCVLNRNKPGYGKTFEAIEYCRVLGLKRILVICPKSIITQWKDQFHRWWPDVDQYILDQGGPGLNKGESQIFITNYESLTPICVGKKGRTKILQPSQMWLKCKNFVWDVIIVDESHRIKNRNAQITLAIKDLPTQRKVLLTGTPILGHPDDLWSQLHFMGEFYSGKDYYKFLYRFCEMEYGGFGDKPIGLTPSESARDLLAKVLNLISVGGNNQAVTEGKNIIPIKLPMSTQQRQLYAAISNLALEQLDKAGITVKNAMDQIIKLQQVTSNPTKFVNEDDPDSDFSGKVKWCNNNPKFDWLRDWLEDNEGERIVVFTRFAETAKALSDYLDKNRITNALYIGAMSEKERTATKEAFVQPTADTRVLIGTIGALGTGVDGLQHVVDNVIFLERDWTPGINEQAEERINRSGHVGMTNVWIVSMKNSIDEYVEKISGKKAEDIVEVIEKCRKLAEIELSH